jgi:hypothetical protein
MEEFIMVRKLAKEKAEQLDELNPITAAERLISQLANESDRAMMRVNTAVGDEKIGAALLEAAEHYRRLVGFSHDVAEITQQKQFEIRWTFQNKLTDYQRRLWLAIKHGIASSKPLPGAKVILDKLKESAPPPKVFQGEAEYRQYLEENNLVEADPNSFYQSRTGRRTGPSPQ